MLLDGLTSINILKSFDLESNIKQVFKAGQGSGQSGSFFFYSKDNRFLIKTLRGDEKQNLVDMLDDYIQHLIDQNGKSLLSKIYGLFEIQTEYFAPVEIIILQNVAKLINPRELVYEFDIKGSLKGRRAEFKAEKALCSIRSFHNF